MTCHHGDCVEVMATMAADSIDACVTDPPYELAFMGRKWDASGIAFDPATWAAVMRVLKPGAHLLAFGGTRTFHRLTCAIEDAGFEIRDCIMWVYGSGFPKSHNGDWGGTALKPAWEPIIVARKPLVGTVAANVAQHGTGAINIDGCRVATDEQSSREHNGAVYGGVHEGYQRPNKSSYTHKTDWHMPQLGRWPSNVIHDGSDEVVAAFPSQTAVQGSRKLKDRPSETFGGGSKDSAFYGDSGSAARFFYCAKTGRQDRDEGLADFEKKALNWSSGDKNPGSFQSPNTDRNARNHHPTVKPTDLMRYLVRLVTPPGGVVLDPFGGSGSTGKAAILEGFECVLIEREAEYVEIIKARMAWAREEYAAMNAQQVMFA